MELQAFFMADHAESVNGKLYVVGGCWNVIFAQTFPVMHPHMSLAASILVPWTATNDRHTIEVTLQDADGKDLTPQKMSGEFEVGRAPGMRAGDDSVVVLVFNVANTQFERAGWYSFVMKIDGGDVGRARFKLQPIQAQATTRG